MKTILFTNARDEDNILEWVVHHLNLGFDHIFIVDHKSIDPIDSKLKIIPRELVTVSRNDGDVFNNNLIINAHKYAIGGGYDWMLYLDADEFLVLNYDEDVKSFLIKYEEFDQVGLNWLLLGSNNHHNKPSDTIISSYTKSEEYLNVHLKSFLNLKRKNTNKMNPHPHVYYLNNMARSVNVEKNTLNKKDTYWFNTEKKYNEVSGYVAHYLFQSYETYLSRKINVPRDDNGLFRDVIPEDDFHKQYNNFTNETIKKTL
jgi:hypothetical protein